MVAATTAPPHLRRREASRHRRALPLLLLPLAVGATPGVIASPYDQDRAGDIAFGTRRDGGAVEIWRMSRDGTRQERITDSPGDVVNGQPAWSPDGRRIAFVTTRTGNREIAVMRDDGTEIEVLTSQPANDQAPAWSPDGRHLVFHSERDGNFELYRLEIASRAVTRLTTHDGEDRFPDWSPDGRAIAFQRDGDIQVLDLGSGEVRRLTSAPELDDMPSWSRDGRRMVFMSRRDGYAAVYVMNADGSDQRNLTPKPPETPANQWVSMWPSWSRDGRTVYFQGLRPETLGDTEIFAMRADGSGLTRLTNAPGIDSKPVAR